MFGLTLFVVVATTVFLWPWLFGGESVHPALLTALSLAGRATLVWYVSCATFKVVVLGGRQLVTADPGNWRFEDGSWRQSCEEVLRHALLVVGSGAMISLAALGLWRVKLTLGLALLTIGWILTVRRQWPDIREVLNMKNDLEILPGQ